MKTKIVWAIAPLLSLFLASGCKTSPTPVLEEVPYTVEDIFAGTSNVFILPSDGTFWSLGYNYAGQLGLGGGNAENPRVAWEAVRILIDGEEFPGVVSVAAGESHTVILKNDNTLWGAGDSLYGELGLGREAGRLEFFAPLTNENNAAIEKVKMIAAGNNSTFFIMDDSSLWASGYNYYGELGLGDRENRLTFARVSSAGQDVVGVAAGVRHTVILKADNTVWTAGYNFNGQLGLDKEEDMNVFTRVDDAGTGAVAIAAGNYHTVILKEDGTVWTAGENYYGQLGHDGAGQRRFVQVRDSQGLAITDAVAIAARGDLTVIQRKDNTLLFAGTYNEPEYDSESFVLSETEEEPRSTLGPLDLEGGASFGGIKKLVLGNRGIYVLASDGSVWAAGSNQYGQLFMGQDVSDSVVLKRVYPVL